MRGRSHRCRKIRALGPDLVLLDVQMPELDGLGVVRAIGPERMPPVVFVTAHDQHAVDAFEVHALDYVLKPVHRARFNGAIDRVIGLIRSGSAVNRGRPLAEALERLSPPGSERLAIRSGERVLYLRVADIDWIEAADDLVRLHVGKPFTNIARRWRRSNSDFRLHGSSGSIARPS
jgi:two-component system LytT family response regulator